MKMKKSAKIKTKKMTYYPTGIADFDRVLGGGFVPGRLLVLGGEHGVGKTTLLLQACAENAAFPYFVSGEMTEKGVQALARRVGIRFVNAIVAGEPQGIDVDALLEEVVRVRAKVLVVDSLQTCVVNGVAADVGSTRMVDAAVRKLKSFAQAKGVAVLAVCHLTKSGKLAGSTSMQHLVDGLLRLERRVAHDEDGVVAETEGLRVIRVDGKSRQGRGDAADLLELTSSGFRTPSVEALRAYVLAVPPRVPPRARPPIAGHRSGPSPGPAWTARPRPRPSLSGVIEAAEEGAQNTYLEPADAWIF